MEIIHIRQTFKQPVETIFNLICDHEQFGKIVGAKIKRIQDGTDGHINGLNSVRNIEVLPGISFEETVVNYVPFSSMEYKVSRGSPIKNHHGKLNFSESKGITTLEYQIQFEPKLPLPFLGKLLKRAIQTPIEKGLKKLAGQPH